MLLTITTTHQPATDLGYLLHKHPDRFQSFKLNFGNAYVYYPEANLDRCTVALLLDIDSVGLVRRNPGYSGDNFSLAEYVNDRPYVASSFMSVAIAKVFSSALSGKCKDRPELIDTPLPISARISILPCRGGKKLLHRLFDPLGYNVISQRHHLDAKYPQWGDSRYYSIILENNCQLSTFLSHLYVLIPVLDDEKHYWVDEAEIEKLIRYGENWLSKHPDNEIIVNRYLKHQNRLTKQALLELGDFSDDDLDSIISGEEQVEQKLGLNEQRLTKVIEVLKESGAQRVIDIGCGEGKLLRKLLAEKQFTEIIGMDVAHQTLKIAHDRLHIDRMTDKQKERINLIQGSLNYRDSRLEGFDAAAIVEVIEHLDTSRLRTFERNIFEFSSPNTIVLTTPNFEFNQKFENLTDGKFRHRDHRFEWTREEFKTWSLRICNEFQYCVEYHDIGETDITLGSPTQMAVFTKTN
ncbi:3' terminal RNA ribose 2'-O-methyltransferase Hen1 [Candidatus Poribacteria bacterium]|nr:3' terminal RNA ribose 2'-O-methyltransferase Hen1 [Candidatus Poribacteria bacterium]